MLTQKPVQDITAVRIKVQEFRNGKYVSRKKSAMTVYETDGPTVLKLIAAALFNHKKSRKAYAKGEA